jgi:hypothetical protein
VRTDLAKVNSAFSSYLDYTGDFALCQRWPYQQRNASDYSPVTSAVTTLLVSGSFDPLTSPTWAQQAATALPNGSWVEFPGLGHDEGASSDACPESILDGFIRSPGPQDTSCVQSMTIAFAAPANTVTVVMQAEREARLPVAGLATPSFARMLAMRSRIENQISRRHVHQRMAELLRMSR